MYVSNFSKERLEERALLGPSIGLDGKKNPTPLLGCDLEEVTTNLTFKNVVKKKDICVCTNTWKCVGEYTTKVDTI